MLHYTDLIFIVIAVIVAQLVFKVISILIDLASEYMTYSKEEIEYINLYKDGIISEDELDRQLLEIAERNATT